MKRNHILKSILLAAATCAFSQLQAEVFTFTDGNLLLGFQATGGQGASENVFVNLGPATTLRDNPNPGTIATLNTVLTTVYGADWYTRADLWFGVVANLNSNPNSGVGSRPAVNGDPSRTLYISQPAATPKAAPLIPPSTYTPTDLGIAGGNLRGMEQVLIPTTDGTGWNFTNGDPLDDGVPLAGTTGILNQTTQQHATAWNNSWTKWNPAPGAGFDIFTGGIQQSFGKGGSATYVDIQRILSTNTGAVPTGVVGGGSYITTIAISSSGMVTATASSSGSPFTTWIGSFNPPLANPADREPAADPDHDGLENLMEFVLNGNPAVSGQSILPTLDASGSNFVFSFTRRADSAGDVTQVFEYSTNLVDWTTKTPITIPSGPGTVGFVTVGASTGTAPNQVQAVTVTVPKSPADAKLFGRLKVSK